MKLIKEEGALKCEAARAVAAACGWRYSVGTRQRGNWRGGEARTRICSTHVDACQRGSPGGITQSHPDAPGFPPALRSKHLSRLHSQ
jgi:hypothetical protein